jgi:D-alanyl-D-alanine carboxypeptidase
MNFNLKIFFIALILSLPFWWGLNIFQKKFEDFLVLQNLQGYQTVIEAQVSKSVLNLDKSLKPLRNWSVDEIEIDARSAISIFFLDGEEDRILFKKNSDSKLPIASITKLITALVVLENYDLDLPITISKEAVAQDGDLGQLKVGEVFQTKELLYPLLIESSNDAAYAFAEVIGPQNFVDLMNLEAKKIGMGNTHFVNSSGVDPITENIGINYSTVEDLAKLAKYLIQKPEILQILSEKEYDLYSIDGLSHHKLSSTNELLGKNPQIIGGKTGWTTKAQGCLLLILKAPNQNKGYLINIILGSEDRFKEMEKIINWVNTAYKW